MGETTTEDRHLYGFAVALVPGLISSDFGMQPQHYEKDNVNVHTGTSKVTNRVVDMLHTLYSFYLPKLLRRLHMIPMLVFSTVLYIQKLFIS